jgi:hypothetical protein
VFHLPNKHLTKLQRPARSSYFILLGTFIHYSCKKFYNIGQECVCSKTSMPREDFKGITSGYQDQRNVPVRIFKYDIFEMFGLK